MPNAHNKTKMTGDTHLPEVESDLPVQGSMNDAADDETSDRAQATERGDQNRPGRGSRKAGVLKDRDSGEGGPSSR